MTTMIKKDAILKEAKDWKENRGPNPFEEIFRTSLIIILFLSFSIKLTAQDPEMILDSVIAYWGTEEKNYKDACFLIYYTGEKKTILQDIIRSHGSVVKTTTFIPRGINFQGARKYVIRNCKHPYWVYHAYNVYIYVRRIKKNITEVKIFYGGPSPSILIRRFPFIRVKYIFFRKGKVLSSRAMVHSLGTFVQEYYQPRIDRALKKDGKHN